MTRSDARGRQPTTGEYLARTPTDEETARRAVEPYRHLTVAERLAVMSELLREMEAVLGGRAPLRSPDDEDFWRHWVDPSRGRPR